MLSLWRTVDRLLDAVRRSVAQLVARSRWALSEGADPDRIQRDYVAAGLSALENAEVYAVLASTGDASALEAIENLLIEMDALHEQLGDEFPERG